METKTIMNSSIINPIINFIYSLTYSIVILGAIMLGIFASNEGMSFLFRVIYLIIGFSALVQIILTTQGYKLSGGYTR